VKTSAVFSSKEWRLDLRGWIKCWFTRGENFCGLLQIKSGDCIFIEGQSTGLREVKTSAVFSSKEWRLDLHGRAKYWFTRGENFCGLLQIRSEDCIYV
jgi:hypothetical protein